LEPEVLAEEVHRIRRGEAFRVMKKLTDRGR